jgi:polar amino acid transport system substrate-binding protein
MSIINKLVLQIVAVGVLSAVDVSAQAACDPSAAKTKYPALAGKTINIGQDGESPPFSMRDPQDFNNLIGLDADMARAVFQCVGIPIKFTTGSWSGLVPATMAGQIDLMWDSLLYTSERAKKMDFVAYMNSATGFAVPKGNPKGLNSVEDLCGVSATANLGTTQEALLRETSAKCVAAGKPALNIITSTDMPSSLRLVESGRADVMAGNAFLTERMARQPGSKIDSPFHIVTGAKLAAGTAKGNSELIQAIKDGLGEVRANGTQKKIYDKYGIDYSLSIDPLLMVE